MPQLSYDSVMKTLTIRLPDDLAERLDRESRERRVSKSDVVRERLRQGTPSQPAKGTLQTILDASWKVRAPVHPARLRPSKKQRLADVIRAKKLPR
jgi:Arc/MetJ-type ribon-helix-helix transcriptional regulator